MERNAYAFAAGLFVLLLGLAALITARWLEGPQTDYRPYLVVTDSSVAGLSPFARVSYRGVAVGQVTDIRFAGDGSRDILITIELEPRVPITINTYAILKSQGLTGIAFLELLDDGPADAPVLTTNPQQPTRIAMQPSLLESFQAVGQGIAEQIQQLTHNVNRLFTAENTEQLGNIIANTQSLTARVDALLASVQPAMARIAPIVTRSESAIGHADTSLQALGETLHLLQTRLRDAEVLLERGDTTLATLGDRVNNSLLPELENALVAMNKAASRIDRLTENLERNPPALLWGTAVPPPGPGEAGYAGD